jgi:hypothetical protein
MQQQPTRAFSACLVMDEQNKRYESCNVSALAGNSVVSASLDALKWRGALYRMQAFVLITALRTLTRTQLNGCCTAESAAQRCASAPLMNENKLRCLCSFWHLEL